MILRDIKVLDFTRLLPGPLAAQWLAEAGATVVKVEDSARPDGIRAYSKGAFKKAALYETLNHSKEILAGEPLEGLAHSADFVRLVQSADVLLEQFKPGLMDKLGLGWTALKEINPRLVYVSLSGYGPDRPEPGHDLNFMAESGLLYQLRDAGGKPVIPRFQMGDVSGSYACYAAVLEGLLERMQTGAGSRRQVSMAAAVLPFGIVPYRFAEAGIPEMAEFLAGTIPNYNVYRCADGEYVALAALEPHLWENAVVALSVPAHLHAAFSNPALLGEVEAFFLSKPAAEWLASARGRQTCLSPVCRPGDAYFDTANASRLRPFASADGAAAQTFKSPTA